MSTLNQGEAGHQLQPINNKLTSAGGFGSSSLMRGVNSSGLLSVMSNSNKKTTPRSNSMMITKQTPKNAAAGATSSMMASPSPIEGSFIVVDHDQRKLSDMGKYRNVGKTTLNKGDSAAI